MCVYIYYTMQYEISGSVLVGQITTTTWAGAPSRTWAWSRAIGGAGRGIGGAGQFASWTRAAQLRTSTWAKAAVARATVPPQAFNSAADLPRARLGRRQRSIGPGRAVDQGGSARDVGLGGGSVEDLGPHVARLAESSHNLPGETAALDTAFSSLLGRHLETGPKELQRQQLGWRRRLP